MNLLYRVVLYVLFSIYGLAAFCQSKPTLNSLIHSIDSSRKQQPIEKLYLQLDKENYIQGDTIWFKAYLLNADFLIPSTRSGLLYVELDDSNNISVNRMLLPLAAGITWGNLALIEKDIPEGSYTLRAYTNWMRNFGEDYVFKKSIYVASAGSNSRLVEAAFKQVKDNIQANIIVTDQNSQPMRLQNIQLRVTNGKRTLFRNNLTTGMDGRVDINFNLTDNTAAKNLAVAVKEIRKNEETGNLTIPIILNRAGNTDLQFMPEGGNMVGGVPARIGFKAISEDGKGTEVSGKVYNARQEEVAAFKSAHKGMGSFELKPQEGEIYTAKLILPDGAAKNYPLPPVKSSGTTLRIDQKANDSLEIKVSDKSVLPVDYYLIGQARGVICYAAHLNLTNEAVVKSISQNLFPTGIAHFTLLNASGQPLNERLVYIDQHDNLQVNITTDKQNYTPHDSIALHILVTDKAGKPVSGSFSLAVTDDSQIRTDSMGGNIVNNLLLTSDLKGTVEEPGYYQNNTEPEKASALDNLLLTQGWVGYNWKQVFNTRAQPMFSAELEFVVNGKVTNMFNKPVANSGVVLLSKKPFLVRDTVTGKDGHFVFKGFLPVDTATFVIQARRKRGSSFNIGLEVDEFKAPVFTASMGQVVPWYVNSDTLLLHNRDSKLSQRMAEDKLLGINNLLREVTIKDKKIVKESKNLNGPGEADFILDQEDMEKAKKMTLFELLQQKYKNIYKTGMPPNWRYKLKGHNIQLVIDGVFIAQVGIPVDTYMDYLTAEDIKGIEIMYTSKYAMAYDPNFIRKLMGREEFVPVYLEITTYSGNGAFMKKVPGVYIYKPIPFTLPKQFYRPRYVLKNTLTKPDLRPTIHWEPDIVTDTAGKATISFYSADKPVSYTVIMQGTDLNGQIGFFRRKIQIR